MARRSVLKRRASRKDRSIRRDLVHIAGCTEPNCAYRALLKADVIEEIRNAPGEQTISVPRSLRPIIGRWL
jgi:hypothetical protein